MLNQPAHLPCFYCGVEHRISTRYHFKPSEQRKCRQVLEATEAIAKLRVCETTFECRSCGEGIQGTSDGRFGYDDRGPWRRLIHIDGPNAICPACVSEPTCLDHLIHDGYDNAAIAV